MSIQNVAAIFIGSMTLFAGIGLMLGGSSAPDPDAHWVYSGLVAGFGLALLLVGVLDRNRGAR